jgi:uncharacterized protein (DUF488 family)
MPSTIYTIGHSALPSEDFIEILKTHGMKLLVDVRTIPKSRHNPHFNSDTLEKDLKTNGIGYIHLPGLGGLRHAKKESVNQGWENASFRGFADYMQTEEFAENLEPLIEMAGMQKTVIMCAEALPWRCHRSLIGDALLARGIPVMDIMNMSSVKEHKMTPWAEVRRTIVIYSKKQEHR